MRLAVSKRPCALAALLRIAFWRVYRIGPRSVRSEFHHRRRTSLP